MSIKLKTAITRRTDSVLHATGTSSSSSSSFSWFSTPKTTGSFSSSSSGSTLEKRKAVLLQLGAALDRGQAYNPTSGEYYKDRMDVAVSCINDFVRQHSSNVPVSLPQIAGEWELVLITVPHGIFRSSPFFLAIQEAYETYAEENESFGMRKADLFFLICTNSKLAVGVSAKLDGSPNTLRSIPIRRRGISTRSLIRAFLV